MAPPHLLISPCRWPVGAVLFPWIFGAATLRRCAPTMMRRRGRWEKPDKCDPEDPDYKWVTQAVHAIHLPSNEVLFWQLGVNTNYIWTAKTACFTPVALTWNIYCSGHVALSNGSILVAGGKHLSHSGHGVNNVAIYRLGGASPGSPWDETVAPMNHARWYPTCTALPDETILAIAGRDENGSNVGIPEIYDPGTDVWTDMPNATKLMPVYPFMFVLPDDGDGQIFYAGS